MKFNSAAWMMAAAGTAMLIAASGASAQSKAVSGTKSDSNVVVVQNDDDVSIRMENGKLVSVERNGKKVPLSQVKQGDGKITIHDADGNVLQVVGIDISTPSIPPPPPVPGGMGGATERSVIRLKEGAALPGKGMVELRLDDGGNVLAEAPKVMIGIQMAQPDRSLAGHFGLKEGEATMVSGVYEGLPASGAGLSPYDIIVAVDGKTPAGQEDIRRALGDKDAGKRVKLTVIQKGERRDVSITLEKYDQDKLSSAKLNGIEPLEVTGMWQGVPGAGGGPDTFLFTPGKGMQPYDVQNFEVPPQFQEHMKQIIEKSMTGDPQHKEQARKLLLDRVRELQVRPMETRPGTELAPSEPAAPAGGRMKEIEKRLERLEELLEKLVERQGGGR
jgi:hypothetical protein